MTREGLGVKELAEAKTSVLLHGITGFLQANAYIGSGEPFGALPTSEFRPSGEDTAGRGMWRPSDHVRNLDVAASLANKKPTAKKFTGGDHPGTVYIIAEKADRHLGATGRSSHTLRALTRLTVAMSAVAAEEAGAEVKTLFIDGSGNLRVSEEEGVDASTAMVAYDRLAASKNRDPSPSGLARALGQVLEDRSQPGSDVCVVASDFIAGGQRSGEEVVGFDWELPLTELHSELKDRLFIVRLTTPALTEPPLAFDYQVNGYATEVDSVDYMRLTEKYAKTTLAKATRIKEALRGLRYLELSSQNEKLLSSTADFIYSEPNS